MQITDEMLSAAIDGYYRVARTPGPHGNLHDALRAALEAALMESKLEHTNEELCDALADQRRDLGNQHDKTLEEFEQHKQQATDCIEDLVGAINYMIQTQEAWEEDVSKIIQRPPNIFNRAIDSARATLKRWGME